MLDLDDRSSIGGFRSVTDIGVRRRDPHPVFTAGAWWKHSSGLGVTRLVSPA